MKESQNFLLNCCLKQVLEVAAGLAEMQTRLGQILNRLDDKEEDPSIWKTRCENLEVLYKEAVTSAKWLRSQNAELEHKVSKYQPEMNNALDARDAAFKRLKHARKVIRDLLEERVSEPFCNLMSWDLMNLFLRVI
jgi:predicted nuclease with TOPRIM domain